MCGTCGCSESEQKKSSRLVEIERSIQSKNNHFAGHNRKFFRESQSYVLNLLSSPGSGKTSLLVEMLGLLKKTQADTFNLAVIEGDQQTNLDAKRIEATGTKALQINTGQGCHLEAEQVGHAVGHLGLHGPTLLFIENVGNLVCPAAFDLGETLKVVVLSVTEGEDKPLKYPDMFVGADLILLNKIDLLPYLDFDVNACEKMIHTVNPQAQILKVSAKTGEGLSRVCEYIVDSALQEFDAACV